MKTGFVVGKFVPFHKGHEFLIRTALEQCDTVVVLSYTSDNHGFGAIARKTAIIKTFASEIASNKLKVFAGDFEDDLDIRSHFMPSDDAIDFIHRSFCAEFLLTIKYTPTHVFTSESYGDCFAAFLSGKFNQNITHVCVDLERKTFPVSATMIRTGQVDPKDWSLM